MTPDISITAFPPEILSHIFFLLDISNDDRSSLAYCARVSKIFHQIATPFLYDTIILSPERPVGILGTPVKRRWKERRNMLLRHVKTVNIVDFYKTPLSQNLVETFHLPGDVVETIQYQISGHTVYTKADLYVFGDPSLDISPVLIRLKPRRLIITDCSGAWREYNSPRLETVETIIVNSDYIPDRSCFFRSIESFILPHLKKLIYIYQPEDLSGLRKTPWLSCSLEEFTKSIAESPSSFRLYMVNVSNVRVEPILEERHPNLLGHEFVDEFLDQLFRAAEEHKGTRNKQEVIEENFAKVGFLTLEEYDRMRWEL